MRLWGESWKAPRRSRLRSSAGRLSSSRVLTAASRESSVSRQRRVPRTRCRSRPASRVPPPASSSRVLRSSRSGRGWLEVSARPSSSRAIRRTGLLLKTVVPDLRGTIAYLRSRPGRVSRRPAPMEARDSQACLAAAAQGRAGTDTTPEFLPPVPGGGPSADHRSGARSGAVASSATDGQGGQGWPLHDERVGPWPSAFAEAVPRTRTRSESVQPPRHRPRASGPWSSPSEMGVMNVVRGWGSRPVLRPSKSRVGPELVEAPRWPRACRRAPFAQRLSTGARSPRACRKTP